ncbi:hypothetical protein RIF29_11147 [Crotalaria pallida]|uniref:Transcription factor CBF/NF-Y/archaeal histone domain-containing protein n=1 Tax=Crotalaria pallida TaxID=3830 RepID=A0AAN9P0I1_CROPI
MSSKRIQTSTVGSPTSAGNMSKEQDQLLPIANISRIMKRALPPNAKISKEAKEKVQECVTEFISFITGEASEKCQREKRKTINGDDLLWAMTTLGFENYVGPLKHHLKKFMENEGEKSSNGNNNYYSPTQEEVIVDGVDEINKIVSTMNKGGFYESQEIFTNKAISQNVAIGDAYANAFIR